MTDATGSTTRRGQVLRYTLLAIAIFLAVLVLVWDWNWFKGPVERRVEAATGRDFRFEGDLDVDLGRVVIIRASDIALENTPWSLTPEMARADLLRVEVPFWPLLRGERTLRRVDIVRPALLLERNSKGSANWQFKPTEKRDRAPREWSFGELRVHDGRLDVRDVPLKTHLRLTVDSAQPESGADSVRLLVRGSGRYRGHPFQLDGWADSPVALLEADAAYRVDMSARAGATRARAHGALDMPINPAHFKVLIELSGNDLEDLYPLMGLAMPSTPPYRVTGELERDGRIVHLRKMEGRVGDSDVTGVASVDTRGEKTMFEADVASSNLDIDDLGGLIGLPPSAKEGETVSPAQRAEAERRAASPLLLPDRDYDLKKLNSMNANVHLHADRVDAGKWPVQTLAMRIKLQDGVMRIDPLDVGFADGRVRGSILLDASQAPIDAGADLVVRGVQLQKMFPKMQPPNIGLLNGKVELRGEGNSVADMLATSDGEVMLGMGRGRFSNLLLELAGLDIAETFKFLIGKDQTVELRCAYGDFAVEDGLVSTRSLVFDTTDTVIYGSGKINLQDETLALEIRPEPKDVSPLSLRGPLGVTGTFKDPSFMPKAKPLLARAAVAAVLFAIAPPAALLALIETGPGEDIDCYTGKKKKSQKDGGIVEADEKSKRKEGDSKRANQDGERKAAADGGKAESDESNRPGGSWKSPN